MMMRYLVIGLLMSMMGAHAGTAPAVPDAMRTPRLRDVKLQGHAAVKLGRFVTERMTSSFAQEEVFGEARRAFERRDDDSRHIDNAGIWRGEFWGKLMLGTARVADYTQDPALLAFVKAECHRLMALQDADGYLGSYANPEAVYIKDVALVKKAFGWGPCWNLWNRKYAIWGMLMAYRATGDRAILDSVARQMDQWIAMMNRLGRPLHDTGAVSMHGLPSMSVLKPLLQLYAETGKPAYLAYAEAMLPDWARADGEAPNFFVNAPKSVPLNQWYPDPQDWAKCYEMMSCLDGLVEHYRTTGARRSLDTVALIRDNLAASEANPFGGVGFGDKFIAAASRINGLSEVCDAIHWIRLNLDLFLVTGQDRYLDAMETAYFNNFLPGVFRRGDYGAFFVRATGRHENQRQCGYLYNHCCVNNVPRTWMDMAEGTVTRDRSGAYHVNFYHDATVTLDGVTFTIAGNYPVSDRVMVTARGGTPQVIFRTPGWCAKKTVTEFAPNRWEIVFEMPVRLVERRVAPPPAPDSPLGKWMFNRYADGWDPAKGKDVRARYRTTPAAQLWKGPLLLAKARKMGLSVEQVFPSDTVYGKGYAVSLKPIVPSGVWGAWEATFTRPGTPALTVPVCDFESAGDEPYAEGADAFSVWF